MFHLYHLLYILFLNVRVIYSDLSKSVYKSERGKEREINYPKQLPFLNSVVNSFTSHFTSIGKKENI